MESVVLSIHQRAIRLKGIPDSVFEFLSRSFGSVLKKDATSFVADASVQFETTTLEHILELKPTGGFLFHKALPLPLRRSPLHLRLLYDPSLRPKKFYYYILEPILINLIKRLGLLPIHAAGVLKDGIGILIPGGPGAGKTSLAYSLSHIGFRLISDDQLYLVEKNGRVEMLLHPDPLAFDVEAIRFFPELAFLKKERAPIIHGKTPKWHLELSEIDPPRLARRGQIGLVFFPEIDRHGRKTRLTRLSPAQTLDGLLETKPRELKSIIPDRKAVQFQFYLLSRLASTAAGYRVTIGPDGRNPGSWIWNAFEAARVLAE